MSYWNRDDDFHERLAELTSWQIEKQKKLKDYQEVQRRLLDSEHQKILCSLKTQNYGMQNEDCMGIETEEKLEHPADIFKITSQPIKLKDPKANLLSHTNFSLQQEESCNDESEAVRQPKRFLKKGEGLARFRMTVEDFKAPPTIYKEKRIKTYLKQMPDLKKKPVSRPVKSVYEGLRKNSTAPVKKPRKPLTVPVNIYVSESKTAKINSARPSEPKRNHPAISNRQPKDLPIPKSPMKSLVLKPSIATTWYNKMKESEMNNKLKNSEEEPEIFSPEAKDSCHEFEKQIKNDEKELKIFEILEGRIDDSSFCSNSSFVARLMEDSLSSTPLKSSPKCKTDGANAQAYVENFKALQRQYLNEDQINRIEDSGEQSDRSVEAPPVTCVAKIRDANGDSIGVIECVDQPEKIEDLQPASPRPKPVSKTILQEYIKNFRKLKTDFAENVQKKKEADETVDTTLNEESPTPEEVSQANQQEMALKIQQKALQDNVKYLLNWEGGTNRKKLPKKIIKKNRIKQPKFEKLKKADKEKNDKLIFDGALLKERLDELEREIEIFRKENRNLTKLQKDYDEDRIKLERERKDFEKHTKEEKERLEAKITEEQKKLQRDKNVFEKYCKQVRNQPSRQEREEMAVLKKEINRLTELLTTKESRWGASQARLRNQLKAYEKEIAQLKTEIEKYKKQTVKKVTFESGKAFNTKIINAINSELGKLRPNVIRNNPPSAKLKNQPLSARSDSSVSDKPIRRIKSVPDLKKLDEINMAESSVEDLDDSENCKELERALRSASIDSGVETNESRYVDSRKSNEIEAIPVDVEPNSGHTAFYSEDCQAALNRHSGSPVELNPSVRGTLRSSGESRHITLEKSNESDGRHLDRSVSNDHVNSAVYDAVFGSDEYRTTNSKILEIKRRLGKLNLLDELEPTNEKHGDYISLTKSSSSRSISNCDSDDSGSYESKGDYAKSLKKNLGCQDKRRSGTYEFNQIIENQTKESGIRERIFEDGRKEICYPNGNVKKISTGGEILKMIYYNGDVKETNVLEGSEKYYYAETKTWHTTYKDGLEVLEFPNGQTERRRPDGTTEISFPNGCVRYCDPSGRDEWRFVDGTVVKTNRNGHKVLLMPNGQKEVHTSECKRREYPDGTIKLLYPDGTQETRYASGRVRLKDKDGNLVMDSGGIR